MNHNPVTEQFVRANGKVYARQNAEIIRMELDEEHFYYIAGIGWVPSVTSILDEAAPVNYGLRRFWKESTPEESETIFKDAGVFGSKTHGAFEKLLAAEELDLLNDYPDRRHKKAILAFADWFNLLQPTDFMSEQVVASTTYGFAGTTDLLCRAKRENAANALGLAKLERERFIDGQPGLEETWLVDFKTSKRLSYNYELQVAAYKQGVQESMDIKVDHTALLRIPTQHKVGYEFKETFRNIMDYLYVYNTYMNLHGGKIPFPDELVSYPNTFRLLKEKEQ